MGVHGDEGSDSGSHRNATWVVHHTVASVMPNLASAIQPSGTSVATLLEVPTGNALCTSMSQELCIIYSE